MSLTRDEWEELWNSIDFIEKMTRGILERNKINGLKLILRECKVMKDQVQSVIGQME